MYTHTCRHNHSRVHIRVCIQYMHIQRVHTHTQVHIYNTHTYTQHTSAHIQHHKHILIHTCLIYMYICRSRFYYQRIVCRLCADDAIGIYMLFLCCNSYQEREQLLLKDQVSRGVHIPDNHWGQEQSLAEKESKYPRTLWCSLQGCSFSFSYAFSLDSLPPSPDTASR